MSDLIWQCIRDNHAYLKKGRGPKVLSAEPGNITNVHNNKFSGLSGKRVASLTIATKGKKDEIVLSKKTTVSKKRSMPSKSLYTSAVSKNSKKAAITLSRTLGVYRPDLVAAATAKYQKIKLALRK